MHKCKPFQDRDLHTTKLMFYLATFPNYQENGTRIASIHLSSSFSCPYESVLVSDKLVTQCSLLLQWCSSEKECGTASGDITFYLAKVTVVVSGRFFSPVMKIWKFWGWKANKRNRSTGISIVNSLTIHDVSECACLVIAARFPVALWTILLDPWTHLEKWSVHAALPTAAEHLGQCIQKYFWESSISSLGIYNQKTLKFSLTSTCNSVWSRNWGKISKIEATKLKWVLYYRGFTGKTNKNLLVSQ